MELRQLKYFVRIVELGSISRASRDLYVAQPALSSQIGNLEDELGVRLLSRSVRGVTPTSAGESLYLHAQAVLRQVARLRHEVTGHDASPGGPVSLGIPTSAANMLAEPLIAAAQVRFPHIQLQIVESLSGHLTELVGNGRLEMGLLFDDPAASKATPVSDKRSRDVHSVGIALLDEELFVLSDLGSAPDKAGTITSREAARLRFVLPGSKNITRHLVNSAFSARGLQLDVMAELDSLSTIQSIVSRGLGATILSLSSVSGSGAFEALSVRSVSDMALKRRLFLCVSDIVALSTATEGVIALIRELVRDLVLDGRWPGAVLVDDQALP